MSRVEMLCWAILAMQAVLTCIGGFIADKIHEIWHIARKAQYEPVQMTDGESILARARFQDSLNELDRTIDKTFHMGPPREGPDYHDRPPGI